MEVDEVMALAMIAGLVIVPPCAPSTRQVLLSVFNRELEPVLPGLAVVVAVVAVLVVMVVLLRVRLRVPPVVNCTPIHGRGRDETQETKGHSAVGERKSSSLDQYLHRFLLSLGLNIA